MNGARPSLPSDCPKELVVLLEDCWNTSAKSRPTFGEICLRLEKFKYGLLSGFIGGIGSGEGIVVGYDFIKRKVEEQSSHQVMLVDSISDDNEWECACDEEEVRILTCPIGHALQFVTELPSNESSGNCDICWDFVVGGYYECRACDFDIHSQCSKLELEVNVFLHRHPLHLLVQNYYNGKPDAICCICEEQVQFSEWVYRCDMCDMDMHALCAKLPEEMMRSSLHEHPIFLRQCPHKTLSCACCNDELRANSWMYTCVEKCTYYAHPSCTLNSRFPPCVFDKAHELSLIEEKEGFYCHRCRGFGFSWYYHCEQCDVNIHLDCKHDMVKKDMCHEVYEELMAQYMTKDNLIRVDEIVQLLDQLLVSGNLGGSLWLSSMPVPKGSMRMVQPSVQRLAIFEIPDLGATNFDDADLRKKIAAETVERKAKRMAANNSSLESKKKDLEMLENVERMVMDVQNSKSVLQGDGVVLDARLERLKIWKHNVEDDMAKLVQSKMRHGPRTCIFYQWDEQESMRRLLTSLRADMEEVEMMLLCEEPGHQHYVHGSLHRVLSGALGEEGVQKVQALLGRGLEVVARAVSTSSGQLTQSDHVTLPILGSQNRWDLGAIDVEKHGKPWIEGENIVVLKKADDSAAEWVLSLLEQNEDTIFEEYDLLRVQYKEIEKGDSLGYTQGSVAWLCKEHVHQGLKAGILKLYPLKYYNSELN